MDWMIMPLKRFADFQGRSRRMEYWMFALFIFLVYMVFGVIFFAIGGSALLLSASGGASPDATMGNVAVPLIGMAAILVIFLLVILIPSIAVGVRRLHDVNRSGWWLIVPTVISLVSSVIPFISPDLFILSGILSVVSLIGSLVLIVFAFLEGTKGPNRFGPDPKRASDYREVFE